MAPIGVLQPQKTLQGIDQTDRLWRPPRLLRSWDGMVDGKVVGSALSSQELFFHTCFSCLFGSLRAQLQGDHDLYNFTLGLLSVWSVLASVADYATRYNDNDGFHLIFWTVYGFMLVLLIMYRQLSVGALMYTLILAFTFLWIALANLRVAVYLPACRAMAAYWAAGSLLTSLCWVLIGLTSGTLEAVLQPIAVMAHHLITLSFIHFVPREFHVPLNMEYHVKKFGSIMTLSMGQMIGAIAVSPGPTEPRAVLLYWTAAAFGFIVLFSLKLLLLDVGSVAPADHAIRCNRRSALTWLLVCKPSTCFCIVAFAAGLGVVMTGIKNGAADPFGGRLLCASNAGMLLVFLLTRLQHRRVQNGASELDPMASRKRLRSRAIVASLILHIVLFASSVVTQRHLLLLGLLALNDSALAVLHVVIRTCG